MLRRPTTADRLASDSRAGWSARRSIRERHRALLREQWPALLGVAAVSTAVTVVCALLTDGPQARGFALGSGLTITACAVAALMVLTSGTAPLMMGEMAEQWTAQQLRPLTQHGWRLVNHFGLGGGDHDHVLVGPGGIVLVETKWGSRAWAMNDRDSFFQAALAQTSRNAKQLSGWHEVARHGRPPVQPVLVLWGEARRDIADLPPVRHERSGVLVMAGDQVGSWALRHGRAELNPDQVEEIWSSLAAHAGKRDEVEQRDKPMPRSLGDLARIAATCLVSGFTGFLASSQLLQLVDNWTLWMVAGALSVTGLEVVRRQRWAWQARALQVGFISTYVLGAVVVTRAYLAG